MYCSKEVPLQMTTDGACWDGRHFGAMRLRPSVKQKAARCAKKVHVVYVYCVRDQRGCIKGRMKFLYASNLSIESRLNAVRQCLSSVFWFTFIFSILLNK